tara:strand:+ start:410 stop:1318 length:909 start_codon:yes stop_codon:yes gene_type:complete
MDILDKVNQHFKHTIDNFPIESVKKLSKKILECRNNIYCVGVGKSETMSNNLANLLKSIGIKAFNLNVLNALHGDIGTLDKNDLVILFSKSGNTKELIEIIEFIKEKKCIIWGISCEKECFFREKCDQLIILPFISELETKIIKTLPTNSCMSQLIFSNILTVMIGNMKSLTLDEYRMNHPAGNIGNKLVKIKDVLINNFPKIEIIKDLRLENVLLEMTKYSIGCCFFSINNEMVGLLTDGDIRRLLINNINKKTLELDDLNTNFYYETDIEKLVADIKVIKKKKFIPILDENKKIIGIIKF